MGIEMPGKRKKYDREFRKGAVRIVEDREADRAGGTGLGRERGHAGQLGEPGA